MKKFYYVVLKVQVGSYQKLIPLLVKAKTFEEAHRVAILRESHIEPEDLEWADGGAYDGKFHYKVFRSVEVSEEDVEILTSYMWG